MHGEPLLRKDLKPGHCFVYTHRPTIGFWVPEDGKQCPQGYTVSNPGQALSLREVQLSYPMAKTDAVKHPSHYTRLKPEPLDCFEQWSKQGISFNRLAAIKYLLRAGYKDPTKLLEDLNKAIYMIERERDFKELK